MKGSNNRMGLTKGSIFSTKLLSSRKIAVLDRYDFKFSVKAAERKHRTRDSTHIQEIEIIDCRKVTKSFQSYLANSNNKTNLGKYLFQKWRKTLPNVVASSQTIYFVNLGGVTQWTQDYFQISVLSRQDM